VQPDALALPVVDALCASLETMAFVSAFPPDGAGPWPCPPGARRVTIEVAGPTPAVLELAASAAFGAVLAANLLTCDPGDPAAAAGADDALKELMNVTCGSTINAAGGRDFELGLPRVEPLTAAEWDALTAPGGGGAHVLEADGHVVAVRARVG
jgi:hypothetical protein